MQNCQQSNDTLDYLFNFKDNSIKVAKYKIKAEIAPSEQSNTFATCKLRNRFSLSTHFGF